MRLDSILSKRNIVEISQGEERYPKEWDSLPDAPKTVYAIGDTTLFRERKFTVVGSRRTPTQALKLGSQICAEICGSFTLVTGTADGGDGAAIEGALFAGGKVICVLAGGFSAIPQGNIAILEKVAQNGLLLSPHAYDTPVRSFSYEYRNKLLAALGEGTLVLGAAEKSGALITAKYALQFKRPVFALPYFPGVSAGAGCNALLKKGGVLTENSFDILNAFGINCIEKKREVVLTESERTLLDFLKDRSESHAVELSQATGIPVFKLRAILSAMEVKGVIVSLGGNRYAPL